MGPDAKCPSRVCTWVARYSPARAARQPQIGPVGAPRAGPTADAREPPRAGQAVDLPAPVATLEAGSNIASGRGTGAAALVEAFRWQRKKAEFGAQASLRSCVPSAYPRVRGAPGPTHVCASRGEARSTPASRGRPGDSGGLHGTVQDNWNMWRADGVRQLGCALCGAQPRPAGFCPGPGGRSCSILARPAAWGGGGASLR